MFYRSNKYKKTAFDNDDLAEPLIQKLEDTVGEKDGTQFVDEDNLLKPFNGICKNIKNFYVTWFFFEWIK